MKTHYLILAVGFFLFISCEKDEIEEVSDLEVAPEEYFIAKVDGVTYEIEDPSGIAGIIYPSHTTGIINFDFWGESLDESKDVDYYTSFSFKVCFYDGPGTYYTGTDKTVSWAMYWSDWELWENHYIYNHDPGTVIITNHTDDFVEGTFEFVAYNENLETNVYVVGKFGLVLEPYE